MHVQSNQASLSSPAVGIQFVCFFVWRGSDISRSAQARDFKGGPRAHTSRAQAMADDEQFWPKEEVEEEGDGLVEEVEEVEEEGAGLEEGAYPLLEDLVEAAERRPRRRRTARPRTSANHRCIMG